MAYVPMCDYDGHLWFQKKHLYYFAVGNGTSFVRYRRRFCSTHVEIVHEDLAEHELVITDGAPGPYDSRMANCLSCGQPVEEGGTQVFITGYPTQHERKDYWGRLHQSHQLPEYMQDQASPRPL